MIGLQHDARVNCCRRTSARLANFGHLEPLLSHRTHWRPTALIATLDSSQPGLSLQPRRRPLRSEHAHLPRRAVRGHLVVMRATAMASMSFEAAVTSQFPTA